MTEMRTAGKKPFEPKENSLGPARTAYTAILWMARSIAAKEGRTVE